MPSEHTYDGEHRALELHLVNKNTIGDYIDVTVISISFELSFFDNSFNNHLFSLIKFPENMDVKDARSHHFELDFLDILDSAITTNPYAYSYKGSITTPKCNEYVSWLVMRNPLLISESQL